MIQWDYYPRSERPPKLAIDVVEAFKSVEKVIDSSGQSLKSDEVLGIIAELLLELGFQVETGKKAFQKVRVPVLFGRNGRVEKSFDADAWHVRGKFVLEVEAGRGFTDNQFLKDMFQACMMHDVDYLAIAVRNVYRASRDYEKVTAFIETLYASNRLHLPLNGILTIGY